MKLNHIVFISSNYPSPIRPAYGTFVRALVRAIASQGDSEVERRRYRHKIVAGRDIELPFVIVIRKVTVLVGHRRGFVLVCFLSQGQPPERRTTSRWTWARGYLRLGTQRRSPRPPGRR